MARNGRESAGLPADSWCGRSGRRAGGLPGGWNRSKECPTFCVTAMPRKNRFVTSAR